MLSREMPPKRIVGSSVTMRCPVCGFTRSLKSLRKDLQLMVPSVAVELWVRVVQKGVKGLKWEQLSPSSIDEGAHDVITNVRAYITIVMVEWLQRFACDSDGFPVTVSVHTHEGSNGKHTPIIMESGPSQMDELPTSPSQLGVAETSMTTPTEMTHAS